MIYHDWGTIAFLCVYLLLIGALSLWGWVGRDR